MQVLNSKFQECVSSSCIMRSRTTTNCTTVRQFKMALHSFPTLCQDGKENPAFMMPSHNLPILVISIGEAVITPTQTPLAYPWLLNTYLVLGIPRDISSAKFGGRDRPKLRTEFGLLSLCTGSDCIGFLLFLPHKLCKTILNPTGTRQLSRK